MSQPQDGALAARLVAAPCVRDMALASDKLDDLLRDGGPRVKALAKAKPVSALLLGLTDHAPYLWRLAQADPARLADLLSQDPDASLQLLLDAMRKACDAALEDAEAMVALRAGKQASHLLIALADIGGVWDVVAVTRALTAFADAAVSSALRYLLRRGAASGRLHIAALDDPETECGFVLLALGKHGAGELNYSSDVDLVAFFDPQSRILPEGAAAGPIFVRLTQALAKLLQERSGDGYALRVDLRLRPDPGSTSVAVSLPAAFDYYETLGQN